MDVHTEGLQALLLLEDTLDREVEHLEEELAWNRRKFVYLQALGCADSDLCEIDRTIQRSEGVIITMKQLLQQTFQDRLTYAEKVELQLEQSRNISTPSSERTLPQPAFHLCGTSGHHHHYYYHHPPSSQQQRQSPSLTRDAGNTFGSDDQVNHSATNDRDIRVSLAMKSSDLEESSPCATEHLLSSPNPKTFKANRSFSKCSCEPNKPYCCFCSTGAKSKRSGPLNIANPSFHSQKVLLQTLKNRTYKRYSVQIMKARKRLSYITKNKQHCILTLQHQRAVKKGHKQRLQKTKSFPELKRLVRGNIDFQNAQDSASSNRSMGERSTMPSRAPNFSGNGTDLPATQAHLLTEMETAHRFRNTGRHYLCNPMNIWEEMLHAREA